MLSCACNIDPTQYIVKLGCRGVHNLAHMSRRLVVEHIVYGGFQRPSVVVNIYKRLSAASSLILLFHIIASIGTFIIWVVGTKSCVFVPIGVELLSLW